MTIINPYGGNAVDQVLDRLWVGCIAYAKELINANPDEIKFIINCTPESYLHPSNITYLQLSWDDGTPIRKALMFGALEAIREGLREGNVLVHCNAGRSRSPALTVAHLMMAGMSWRQAEDLVGRKRFVTQINPIVKRSIVENLGSIGRIKLIGEI